MNRPVAIMLLLSATLLGGDWPEWGLEMARYTG